VHIISVFIVQNVVEITLTLFTRNDHCQNWA